MMMLVYFFAVIGVIASVYCLIGWMFREANIESSKARFDWKSFFEGEEVFLSKEAMEQEGISIKFQPNDFEEQMKAHRRGHKTGN